jgi:aldehyde dehydrogenase (NAD+)
VVEGAFENAGQICSSASKLLVEASIADELAERLAARAARITIGAGKDDPDLGPVVSDEQHDRVLAFVSEARGSARLIHGGTRPADLPRGWFVAPTILDQVAPEARIAREEVFGPVVTITRFTAEAEALAIANGTGYGLVAGVYTRDISRALRLAQILEAGSVWINGWFLGGQQAPTGGIKDSGIGRERGLPGVRNYLQVKNVGIRL